MTIPNSYVNRYRNRETGEEYDGMIRFADRGYAEYIGKVYIGKVSTGYAEYIGTFGSDDEPDNTRSASLYSYD